jgi:hypothetical protein
MGEQQGQQDREDEAHGPNERFVGNQAFHNLIVG